MNALMNRDRPPLSVRAQRVLLWILAVMMVGNGLVLFMEAGGGAFGIGYALPYALLTACFVLFAVRIGRGEKWVWVGMVVLYGLLTVLQVGRFLGGDPAGFLGFLFLVVCLALALRSSARAHFSRQPRPPGV